MPTHLRLARCALAWAALPPLVGCTRVSDESRFEPNTDTVEILATVPRSAQTDVSVRPQLDLCWSDLIDPRSLGDLDALVSSGSTVLDTELRVQLRPWRGPNDTPVDPEATEPWCAGSVLSVTPKADLVGGVRYRLRLGETAIGWAGESINTLGDGWIEGEDDDDATFLLEFTTAEDPAAPVEPQPPTPVPTLRDLFASGSIFDPERATCSCHRDPDDNASALLDLTSADTAFDDLVRAVSPQDTGFPTVTPRRPSESFLLHKLLRESDDRAIFGIRGAPMPKGAGPIPYADYVAVARWIEAGAEP